MNLDFEKALTYIAKDPGWSNKILAGGGLLLRLQYLSYLYPC